MASKVAAKTLDEMTHEDDVLLAIQQRLKVPKGETNEYGGYTYRSLEDINQAVKPIAAEYGSYVTYTDDMLLIGQRYYVKATCTLVTPFRNLSVTAYAREADARKGMDSAQITGAASSYARKYAAQGLFALDGERDPDAMAPEPQPANNAPQTLDVYEVRCRQCGNPGHRFTREDMQTAVCHRCGAIDWGVVQ